jgi:hypothetical protein
MASAARYDLGSGLLGRELPGERGVLHRLLPAAGDAAQDRGQAQAGRPGAAGQLHSPLGGGGRRVGVAAQPFVGEADEPVRPFRAWIQVGRAAGGVERGLGTTGAQPGQSLVTPFT